VVQHERGECLTSIRGVDLCHFRGRLWRTICLESVLARMGWNRCCASGMVKPNTLVALREQIAGYPVSLSVTEKKREGSWVREERVGTGIWRAFLGFVAGEKWRCRACVFLACFFRCLSCSVVIRFVLSYSSYTKVWLSGG
jgi:hypothetical protein